MSSLMHYGRPKRSGRYKWGSGLDPFHHGADAPGGHRGNRVAKKLARKAEKEKTKSQPSALAKARTMSDDELRTAINRMRLEKTYKELQEELYMKPKTLSSAKKFIGSILMDPTKDIAKGVIKYSLGTIINNTMGKPVINTKKKK